MSEPLSAVSSKTQALLRTDAWIFRACSGYVVATTLVWLYFVLTQGDGGRFFGNYQPTLQSIGAVLTSIIIFWFGWSYAWYLLKRKLLRRIGFSGDDLDTVFSTRLGRFELDDLLRVWSAGPGLSPFPSSGTPSLP